MGNDRDRGPGDGWEHPEGRRRLQVLAGLSAALASRDREDLRLALEMARLEVVGGEVEEVLLQSYLFLGYPLALSALGMWRELSDLGTPEGVADDWEGWSARGEAVCRRVYGGQYEGLRENIRILHPDLERWMVVEGYGKVLGRPGLDLASRELCISALLAVLGAPRQLYSHLRGALNTGATPEQVETALAQASGRLDERGRTEVREVWDRVLARHRTAGARASGES